MRRIKAFFSKFFACIAIHVVVGLRPLFGMANCRYLIGCTDFAVYQLQNKPFLLAVWAIVKRVVSCTPWGCLFD